MNKLLIAIFLFSVLKLPAQVKIGNNPGTINSNSMLEIESTDKGFLPPRVALSSFSSISPLSATVPPGMLVFSSGGSLADGFYYWNGSEWKKLDNGNKTIISKASNATLTKSESYVVASNNITITLPAITASDNGLELSIKNIGIYTDLVTVVGSGASTIDGIASAYLTKNVGLTFTAYNSNWIINGGKKPAIHLMEVDDQGSWNTLNEAIEFLNLHMSGPTVIRLSDETYEVSNTLVINLPYSLTIQGLSYGTSNIEAATGLTNKPMFRCFSDVYFKMLNFDATALASYGNVADEDAIRLLGSGTYNEVKDCSFDGFYNTIIDSSNAELWLFETDIKNAKNNGVLIHGAVPGVSVKVAETDFISCKRGINLSKGSGAIIQLSSGGYYNSNATDSAIVYNPATFTSFSNISIKSNLWNGTGNFISGFDFTRSDQRDANVIMENNSGVADKKPFCFINVLNSVVTKTLPLTNTWYKADWGSNTSSNTCKWTIVDNKITYQPSLIRDGFFTISGNLSVSSSNQDISIGIVKNGNTALRYGETTLRVIDSNRPFQFSFIAYLKDINPGDYFEIYYSNGTATDKVITMQDIQWLTSTQ